ncbi:hypothetical protein [Pantanalinema sp. GBBB05]|uniref:hypothetical protein n=1 Tax=Pantanalinema sp. GBBB05 TaxID=2604139 RepID=UPI001D62E658|nr:hypothetical protein [Pantanalinema sp. GBBB05]
MASSRSLKLLHRIGWEFWLPLPIIAVLFWFVGNFMTAQVLSRPYDSIHKLQADPQLDFKVSVSILAINAKIDQKREVTTILIRTTDAHLKKLEYEFPTTETDQVETALAQELKMSTDTIRKIISYRIKD